MPTILRSRRCFKIDRVAVFAGVTSRSVHAQRIVGVEIPTRRCRASNRPGVCHLPFLFTNREVVEKLLLIQARVDILQIVIKKPQRLESCHNALWFSWFIRTRVLTAAMVPWTNHGALRVFQ